MIFDNPLFLREAARPRREWPLWTAITLFAAALEAFIRSRYYFQIFPFGRAWGQFAQILSLAFRVPALAGVYFIFSAVGRENRSGGWAQLSLTGLSPRELLAGFAAAPFLYMLALSVLLIPFSYYWSMLNYGASPQSIWRNMAVALPFGLVEDAAYALAVCMISLNFALRGPFAQAALSTGLTLAGLGVWIMVCIVFSEYLALSMPALTGSTNSITLDAAFHAAFAAPLCAAEAWAAWWAGKSALQRLEDRALET